MALTGIQYQSMRLKFRGLISNPYWSVSEAELDNFIGQLLIDATGSITVAQTGQTEALLAGALTSPAYTAQPGDINSFFVQLYGAVPAIIQALPVARYQQLKNQLTGALSVAGIRTEAQMLAYVAGYNGNFASFFTGVLHYIRSDLGITQAGGNITGWADQSGAGANVIPAATSVLIGTVGAGLNGHASVLMNGTNLADGSDNGGQFTIVMAIPCFIWAVWRLVSNTAATGYFATFDGGEMGMQMNPPNNLAANNGVFIGSVNPVAGSWGRSEAAFAHSASDYIKFGSATPVSGDTGSSARVGARGIGRRPTGGGGINIEILTIVHLNNIPTAQQKAAAASAAVSFYGAAVAI